jgi:hypothetical protein
VLAAALVCGVGAACANPDLPPSQSWRCTADSGVYAGSLQLDQAANAALIAAVAGRMGMPPRAVTIALATAMQESHLRNLDYGDRDSLGLFQQRPSQGWGSEEQVMDPLYSSAKFFEALAAVPDYQKLDITVAAQAVQRSAYPEAYAKHEPTARPFASALSGQDTAALTCTLPEAERQGDPGLVASAATREWGVDVRTSPATTEAGAQVEFDAPDPARGWAYAHWAVAKANDLDIQTVAFESKLWTRTTGEWTDHPEDQPPPAPVVRVTLSTQPPN